MTQELNINRSTWKKVQFGEVVAEVRDSTKDASGEGIEHVVGLEHIDPEDVHLRRSASIEESTTFTKKFASGDVLFGRRRAYLKKAAQSPFAGICSGDITVMRAKEEYLLPELLPFVVNNDKFFDYAIKHSAGGLSPRVKFKDLANYEFHLPPKAQQAALAELLWAMDAVVEKQFVLQRKLQIQATVYRDSELLGGETSEKKYCTSLKKDIPKNWLSTTIGGLLDQGYIIDIQDGNHGEIHPKSSDYVEQGIPFIMANTLGDGKLDFDKSKKLPQHITDNLRKGFSHPGDVLLSHKGTVGEVALVPQDIKSPYLMLTPQVTFYRTNPGKLSNEFLYHVFRTNYFQSQLLKLSSQSTRAYVGITAQRKLKLVLPVNLKGQLPIVNALSHFKGNLEKQGKQIRASKSLLRSLINQIF